MPPLTDPATLAQFRAVLAEWNCTGYINAKEVALDWIAHHLGGLKLKDVAKAMHDYVAGGGVIDQVKETRSEWSIWPFHYDFRLSLGGRILYIESCRMTIRTTQPS
jgi:hypothetical protein